MPRLVRALAEVEILGKLWDDIAFLHPSHYFLVATSFR
jgi:hypothetical protein